MEGKGMAVAGHPNNNQEMDKEEEEEPELQLSDQIDDEEVLIMETFSSRSRRCCSFLPCFGSRPDPARSTSSPSVWERLQQTAEMDRKWWAGPLRGLKKIREWSEIIAGPKWKTFIRRFNRNGRSGSGAGGGGGVSGKFNYDPLSYSLNFDDGNGHHADDYGYFPDFSSRFASGPLSCKSSMDLGKNGISSDA